MPDESPAASAAQHPSSFSRVFPKAAGWHARLVIVLESTASPLLDLAVRIWIGQIFFASGLVKLMSWSAALWLAANEYPVSWMDPVVAAYTGAAVELVGPVLLVAGLLTRPAALAMLVLTVVTQVTYRQTDAQLLWIALLGWFTVAGAGPLSLDHAFRGLAGSAIPFAAPALRLAAWVRRVAGPIFLLALRLWIALAVVTAALAGAKLAVPLLAGTASPSWLPAESAPRFPLVIATGAAAALALGLGTRYVAVLLILGTSVLGVMEESMFADLYWIALLGLLAVQGAGRWSVDSVGNDFFRKRYPELDGKPSFSLEGLPRVVIVGAGFGGLSCAAALSRARVAVTLIDRVNYHLFQPLLYQVATASLSPGDVAAPVRPLFRQAFNTDVVYGNVTGVDTAGQAVLLGERRIPYDYLVLGTGATHGYFGRNEWSAHAPGLKRIEDATEIRRRLLTAFEKAEATQDADERRALLTFLIVGAGPTGVELAGAIAELARFGMEKEFRRFDPATTRVLLVQSGPRVLPTFPESLSAIAKASLEQLGVEVYLNSRVEHIDADGVRVSGTPIAARTVLWAAGVVASPAAQWIGAAADNAGRIKVGEDLIVDKLPNVYAIGDTAASQGWKGAAVPGLAPAAKQGGKYVARHIIARVNGRTLAEPFAYRHLGSLATIGRKYAVVDFGWVRLWGTPAWWLWGVVHVGLLVGIRNRLSTMVNWFWSYLTYRSAIRLITGTAAE